MNRKRKKLVANMANSAAKKSKKAKEAAESGERRISFKTFHEQMEEINVPRVHLGFDHVTFTDGIDDGIDTVDLATSNFGTVLLKWRELNLSENFGRLTKRVMRAAANLKQVVHNKDVLVDALEDASKFEEDEKLEDGGAGGGGSHQQLEPVLELWCALSKDLQQDFAPYYDRFSDCVVAAMTLKTPDVIRAGFAGLNETLKTLQRRSGDENALAMFTKVLGSALARKLTPHALALIAEAVSNVVRRSRAKNAFFKQLLQFIVADGQNVEVCVEVALLACSRNVMAKGKLGNVDAETVGSWINECISGTEDIEEEKEALLWATTLERMRYMFAQEDFVKCSETLLTSVHGKKEDKAKLCFEIARKILELNSSKKKCSTPDYILDFLLHAVSCCGSEVLPSADFQATLLPAFALADSKSPQVRQKMASVVDNLLSGDGYGLADKSWLMSTLGECDCFDAVCLPRVLDYWKVTGCGEVDSAYHMAKSINAICAEKIKSCSWQAYVMEVPKKLAEAMLLDAEIRLDGDEDMTELLGSFVYLRPLSLTKFLKVCRKVQNNVIVSDKLEGSADQVLFLLVRAMSKLVCQSDMFKHLLPETLSAAGSMLNKDSGASPNLVETMALLTSLDTDKSGLAAITDLRPSLIRLLSSPDRQVRRDSILALRDVTGEKVFELMLIAEGVEPTVHKFRERMVAVGKLKTEDTEMVAVLRFLFGNLFVSLSLLWKPTIQMIEEFSDGLESSEMWDVMRDIYESTSEDAHARGLVLQCIEALSNTNEKVCRFVLDDFLDNVAVDGVSKKTKLVQGYARVFAKLHNVRSAKRFGDLRAVMAKLAGDFDYTAQKEGLNFFVQAFKDVRAQKDLLGQLLDKDRWKDNLRALPEKLSSANVSDTTLELLSFLMLGHLRRTVQDKSKKQQDTRRFILQWSTLLGKDFHLSLLDYVVKEAAPQLGGGAEQGGEGENLGMALDICILSCPLLPPGDPATRKLNDYCVDLLCLIGVKLCTTKAESESDIIRSKTRSRLLSVIQRAFKGFKGLTMNEEQQRRFVSSCMVPVLRRDGHDSSTQVSPKLVSVLDAWLDDPRHMKLFSVEVGENKDSVLSLLNVILASSRKIESGFLAKLLDRMSKYFVFLGGEGRKEMLPLANQLLQWLAAKQPLRHRVALEARLGVLTAVTKLVNVEFVRTLVGRLSDFPVPKLQEDQVSIWFGALENAVGACKTLGENVPDKAFKLLGPGAIRELHFKIKVGRLLLTFTELSADKDTVLEPHHLMSGYKHSRQNFLYILHCSLGHIGSTDLGQLTPALDSLMLMLDKVAKSESEEEFNFVVQQFLMKAIQRGLRSKEDAIYTAFISILQFLLKTGKFRGLDDLRALTCVEEEEVDFLENMKHLQVHRRCRALRNLAKKIAESGEDKVLTKSTLTLYIQPMVSRCMFNPTFKTASELIAACVAMISAIAHTANVTSYIKMLARYMQVEIPPGEKAFAKQKFQVVASVLDSFHFNSVNLEDKQKVAVKTIVAKLLRSIKSGNPANAAEEADAAADGANLHVYVALAKITTSSFELFQDLIQSILIELCNKLRVKDHKFRQQVRGSLAEVMQILGPTYLHFLITVLETSLKRGYQLHICVYTISYIVFALKKDLDEKAVKAVLPKVLHYVALELFSDLTKEKKIKEITKKTPEASKISSFPLLQILSSAAGKDTLKDLVQPFANPRAGNANVEKVQKMKQALTSVLAGLNENPSLDKTDHLLLAFAVFNGKLFEGRRGEREIPVDNNVTREFAFNIVLSVLKRHDKISAAEMKPFFSRVVSGLEEKNIELCLISTRILGLLLTHKEAAEHLQSAGMCDTAFRTIHGNLRRHASMKDNRIFSQSTAVVGKLLKGGLVTPTKDTAAALQAFFLTCLEREPTQSPKILLSVLQHVPMEETRQMNLRLCKTYVECAGGASGKALQGVAAVLRHQRMKRLTMEFMVQNMGYEDPQGTSFYLIFF
jgi:hypothetical protein